MPKIVPATIDPTPQHYFAFTAATGSKGFALDGEQAVRKVLGPNVQLRYSDSTPTPFGAVKDVTNQNGAELGLLDRLDYAIVGPNMVRWLTTWTNNKSPVPLQLWLKRAQAAASNPPAA